MNIQPRGFKRISTSSTLMISIRRAIEQLAARHNCSKSFVIATLLAEQLGIKEQVKYYEINSRNQKRNNERGRATQIRRVK